MDIDEALICADDEWESTSVERTLAAEVRRLREENERLRESAKTIGELEQLAARSNNNLLVEIERLREENERLREENERQRFDILAMNQSLDLLREENERLRIEYIALRADAERIDWLADVNNTVGNVILPREIVESNIGSLRQAIDAARGAKPEPAP